jgi:hypothetical protein
MCDKWCTWEVQRKFLLENLQEFIWGTYAYKMMMLKSILIKEGVQWIQLTHDRIHTRQGIFSRAEHPLLKEDLAAWGQYIINPSESQKVWGIRRQTGKTDCLPWPNHSHTFNTQQFSQNWDVVQVIHVNTMTCQFQLTNI